MLGISAMANFFLKSEAEGEPSPPLKPLFPLSLCYPLPNLVVEGCPSQVLTAKKTPIKLSNVVVGIIAAYLTRHSLRWRILHWAVQGKAELLFNKLRSYVTRLLPFRFISSQIRLAKWRWGKRATWEELPLDALGETGRRLLSRLDVLRFRSVCKSWRLALPSPTLFPLRVPPLPSCDPSVPYFMTELNIYLNPGFEMGCCFLYAAVEEVDRGGRFARLLSINPEGWRVRESIGKWFMGTHQNHPLSGLVFCGKSYLVRRSVYADRASFRYSSPLLKVVVVSSSNQEGARVSSNAEGVNPSYVKASELTAVAMLWDEPMRGRLAVLRLGGGGGGDWNWDTGFCSHVFEDIATYKGNLCAIDFSGRAFLMDYHSLKMTQIALTKDITPVAYGKRLFEFDGELYLVDKSGVKVKNRLLFYKLDWQRREWVAASQFEPNFVAFGPTGHCT